jgi:uncharacterized repeat protein (TIGR03837 family)
MQLASQPPWNIVCRVVDHRGDAGVCWRLARALAVRGVPSRLWIDRPEALAGMADDDDAALVRAGLIAVQAISGPEPLPPSDLHIAIETFGCGLPGSWREALATATPQGLQPVWVNLEYLSAEPYVERSHGLASPQASGGAAPLNCWFYYPGFTSRTGGLLQDVARPADVHSTVGSTRSAWRVSRYDYHADLLPPGLEALAAAGSRPVCLLQPGRGAVPATEFIELPHAPWLTQAAYDQLLASCDFNIVRGEDSFVRAQWAARPMLWHVYPQADGAHAAKLEAWLQLYLQGADARLAQLIRRAHLAYNGLAPADDLVPAWHGALAHEATASCAPGQGWRLHAQAWRDHLLSQADLATQLIAFVQAKRTLQVPSEPG